MKYMNEKLTEKKTKNKLHTYKYRSVNFDMREHQNILLKLCIKKGAFFA